MLNQWKQCLSLWLLIVCVCAACIQAQAATSLSVSPGSGRGGSSITVSGAGYTCPTTCAYGVYWDGATLLGQFGGSSFQFTVTVPVNAVPGCHSITTRALRAGAPELAAAVFTVEDTLPPREVARRHALELLEESRNTGVAPDWKNLATLGSPVRELYRPDVNGVAYYEFPVINILPGAGSLPAGFIIVATAGHDFMIPHWNFKGLPPTKLLENEARQLGQPAPAKYFQLDTTYYAAEDSMGNRVATTRPLPPKVNGVDPAWLNLPSQLLSAVDWVVPNTTATRNDGQPAANGYYAKSGPGWPTTLTFSGWDSWQSLKLEYAQNYSVYHESLRRAAREDWISDLNRSQYGTAVTAKQVLTVPMLFANPTYWFSGPGAGLIKSHQLVQQSYGLPLLQIEITSPAPTYDQPLVVHISYLYGALNESRTLVVIGTTTPPPPVTTDKYSELHEHWWAGAEADQRMYDQIGGRRLPNTSNCSSGCGATAWSMLLGWADHQAWLGHPVWRDFWGLYRENGGRSPLDADAPRDMDAGVMNMMWEIRQLVDTFCSPSPTNASAGSTYPSDMGEVGDYLNGRTNAETQTRYNVFSWHESRIRDRASDAIKGNLSGGPKPVIVGMGFFEHYELAWAFARNTKAQYAAPTPQYPSWQTYVDRRFYVNRGWGGYDDGWVKSGFWFAGTVSPD